MKPLLILSLLTLTSPAALAQDASDNFFFSAGTGWPYFVNLKAETVQQDDRYYLNIGQGMDFGASIGWERILDANRQHSLGVLAGAVGIRDNDDTDCGTGSLSDCFADLFDDESVYGLGLTYTYMPQGFDSQGWQFNFVVGYGEGRDSNDGHGTGSLNISYRF